MTTTDIPSIFTKIINREIPGFISYEDDIVAVLISLEGHPLVIPKVVYRDIYELPEDVAGHIMRVAVRIAKALKEATNCDGMNIVQSNGSAAGQEVFHFHLQIYLFAIDIHILESQQYFDIQVEKCFLH